MKFSKEFLFNEVLLDFDKQYIVKDEIIEHTRWSVVHKLIFKYNDKYYQTIYSVGATECQDEKPFENEPDEIECEEVKPVEKTITAWEKVE